MDFEIPQKLRDYLSELDAFIEKEIKPLENQDDNIRFFDHRREHARTDWDNQGLPREDWEELLREMRRRADAAGHLRYALPEEFGGSNGSNLDMAVIREHLAAKGLGLHNDLQNESSIVGNLSAACWRVRTGWLLGLPNLIMALMQPGWRPARCRRRVTVLMAGSSMAKRCGIPGCMLPITI